MNSSIQINVADLKPVMQGFSKVIQKRSTLPVLGCVLFECTVTGLQITGTNLDDYLSRTIPMERPQGGFQGVVSLESLSRIVKGCSNDAVLTITPHKDEIRVQYPVGGTTITERLTTLDVKEFPAIPGRNFTDPLQVGDDFKEALLVAFDSASTDSSRYILQSAFVDVGEKDAHYIVATNGREMFSANSFKLDFEESLIIPHRKFLLWNGFVDDGDWNICLAPPQEKEITGWIKVQSANWTLITKQIEGNYPNWKAPIPAGEEKLTVTFSEQACEFLRLAAPKLPGHQEQLKPIAINAMQNGTVILQAGKGDEAVNLPITGVTVKGEPIRFCINRDYLLKALKLGLTELQVFDPNTPVIFRKKGRRLVIAPLRDDTIQPSEPPPTESTAPKQIEGSAAEEPTKPEPEPEMNTINRIEQIPSQTTSTETAPTSAFVQVKEQLETIKDRLRNVVGDLNDTIKLMAQAQKEKKATEREIEGIRETLRGLQQVRI